MKTDAMRNVILRTIEENGKKRKKVQIQRNI